jgi:hypothetical protein
VIAKNEILCLKIKIAIEEVSFFTYSEEWDIGV